MRTGTLTRFAHLMRDPDPAGARRAAQELYDQHDVLVIFPADVANGRIDSMWVEAIGRRLYGGKGR
jgi:hypothetical protein